MMGPAQVLVSDALVSLLDASDDPFFTLDLHGHFTYANPAAASMVHLTPRELIGRSLEQDFSHAFSPQWLRESRRAWEEGRPVQYDAFNPAYGGWVQVQVVPSASGLAVRIRNVTQHQRTAALQRFTAALSDARGLKDVVSLLIREATTASGAYMGALVVPTPDGQHLRLLDEEGYTPELRARFTHFPLSLDIPPCDAARRRVPVFVSGEVFDLVYPESVGVRAENTRSLAALPLVLEGGLWGVLCLSFQEARRFDEPERQFLHTLVEQATQALARVTAIIHQQEQAELLRTLNRVNQLVSAELDLDKLVQAVTDAGVELTGAQFGAFFYNVVNERQESYTLYTLSGVPREAFAAFPMPRNTKIFGPTFAGEGVVRVADITQDPRYGQNPPYRGMPAGHLPVRSYLAVPVKSRSGEVLGGLFFGHAEPDVFSERAEQLVVGLAAQTAVAVDNARLYQQLQDSHAQLERRVQERTRELEEQRVALDAFADFTERTATTTNVHELARYAADVLRATLGSVSVGYYELEGDRWMGRVLSDDVPSVVVDAAMAGFPVETPSFARAVREREALFVDGWDAQEEGVESTQDYGAAAFQPYFMQGQPFGLFTMASAGKRAWSPREQAVFQAVTRSLGLALERAEQTAQLAVQNAELAARTRALEAFAHLSRDLSLHADQAVLIRRAQEIMLSLLGDGYALYWRPNAAHWVNHSLVGSLGNPGLEAAVARGLSRGQAPTLDTPWETGQPLYQDEYARGADTDAEVVRHVNAVAMLPVLLNDEPHGLIGVGLFEQRQWTPIDRAVLESVARSLSVALEGAESARALQERTLELERSNAELEKFAYVASHDLQEPLRTVTNYAELLARRYSGQLDARADQYLGYLTHGSRRMRSLIQDLLSYSRLSGAEGPGVEADANVAWQEARSRLTVAMEESQAAVTVEELPRVPVEASRLVQLFQNLLGNALKFRREGVPPVVHVSVTREDAHWHFTVRDNGIGIEPAYRERIFEVFQRLHTREAYEGNGIGLSLCKKIVEQAGGQLWVDSTPGEGSTFHFTLPALQADP